jgi:hypothetical protein
MHAHRLRCLLAVSALALLAAGVGTAAGRTDVKRERPGTWCGGVLWRLMTLSDEDRNAVNLLGTPTTIAEIAKLRPPRKMVPSRTTPFQRQVWRLRAVIDRYRIASNGEIVLILYSIETAQYMNVYLPNPHCLGARARNRTGMIVAQRQLISHCPRATPVWELLGVTVDVAGVGFWNPNRATRGALSNGAELRPLTSFKIVSGCGI